ncbi:hypothetical protein BJ138DRAFT_1110030 [Hygrophoropsis aurantiaca]|uniref:Uncharacterized protein n=1 Tax=Hygrophoropsis aurantiaca TaxID=72124 RepID=A0ACB8APJ1_9AGAM|nr:hypothetical protein BJ138DRAFT_1110030 [Hygrophoropsis aurantiaca]
MVVFEDLPFDVLCKVINYLSITNILHLRQVSKHLQQVTLDRSIWSHAYRTSSLVRPQGPFPWQSAAALESILVRSARLTRNWPPNPDAAPVRARKINVNGRPEASQLLCGRWLLMLIGRKQILCYDLDRTDPSTVDGQEPFSILYTHEAEGSLVQSFQCVTPIASVEDTKNPCIFLTIEVRQKEDPGHIVSPTLYKLNLAEGTLVMLHQADIRSTPISLIIGPMFLAMYKYQCTTTKDALFVDAETFQRYQFPEQAFLDAETQLKQAVGENYRFNHQHILTTSTHVLLIRYYGRQSPIKSSAGMLIQAYEIPSRQELVLPPAAALQPACTTLQLSHATLFADMISFTDRDSPVAPRYPFLELLRDSTLDNITGTTHITLTSNTLHYVCVIPLRLDPRPDNGIGSITFEPSKNTIRFVNVQFQPSYNGHTRAVKVEYSNPSPRKHLFALEIDDEDLAATQTPHKVPHFRDLPMDITERVEAYDMYRGRIILRRLDAPDTLRVLDFL